jgi:hypothetical protein
MDKVQPPLGMGKTGRRKLVSDEPVPRAMRTLVAGLLLVSLTVAGCIAPEALDPAATGGLPAAETVYAGVAALMADLPCEASGVPATGTSDNLLELVNIDYPEGTVHGELDIKGDWLLAARLSNGEEDPNLKGGGFDVTNIRDPANPVVVAHYVAENGHALDVKFMPDNKSAIVGHTSSIDLVDLSAIVDSPLDPLAIVEANISPALISVWQYPAAETGEAL